MFVSFGLTSGWLKPTSDQGHADVPRQVRQQLRAHFYQVSGKRWKTIGPTR
jgi:hypothetical protein